MNEVLYKYCMLLKEVFRVSSLPYGNLYEMRIDTPTGPLTLAKNLPANALDDLLASSTFGNVRGLLVGRDIYYWDAAYATHDQVGMQIGVAVSDDNRVVIYRDHGKVHLIMPSNRDRAKAMGFGFKRILKDPGFQFEDPEAGVMTGEQYSELIAA